MTITEKLIQIPTETAIIAGTLTIPTNAKGLVVFAHGSGSSRHSPRNKFVAQVLNKKSLGTLLMDLLTTDEDRKYETRFDIELLTHRLIITANWVSQQPQTQNLKIGFFGASTGAAAALQATAALGSSIGAVVSRGGRPDLAAAVLDQVQSPVLLIVGGNDFGVIELNEQAFTKLESIKELSIIPGASHLFEESGTLEQVASLATSWFQKYLISIQMNSLEI